MQTAAHKRHLIWHVREWREKFDLSQEQLAELIGTNKGQVSKLETGLQRLNDTWIVKICEALGIEPADLLRDPAEITLADLLRGASPEERQTVRRMVAGFLQRSE